MRLGSVTNQADLFRHSEVQSLPLQLRDVASKSRFLISSGNAHRRSPQARVRPAGRPSCHPDAGDKIENSASSAGVPFISQTPVSHQGANESRPAGLMRGAAALTGIAMKILVEEQ